MNAFADALERESKGAARDALVQGYEWANRQTYGSANSDLRRRANEWADKIEAAGQTAVALEALASAHTCPHCGR